MKLNQGFSGAKVELHKGRVHKTCQQGTSFEAFSRQMKFLLECEHPNFVKIRQEAVNSYSMPYYEYSFLDYLKDPQVGKGEKILKFEELLRIVNHFDAKQTQLNPDNYLNKLTNRTGLQFSHNLQTFWLPYGFVHGDLTIENIMLDNDENFVFIDPRGTFESKYYDYGKLGQSLLCHYENPGIADPYLKNVYEILGTQLSMNANLKYLKFYTGVHLIGAYPFWKKGGWYHADRFLAMGIQLFNDINIKVHEQEKA